ncbi:glycerophosphoryl diester phosphodiesterase membrane domain-containing protein [Streptomyces sp. NPDC014995]|uniref:glycerophosphoryl diester phosphodiesterase membrane domain-containing protein n=1 Tax=Streptomyces sp. NPDC014995 TaxID=3364936 RepID=UPI0036FCED6F
MKDTPGWASPGSAPSDGQEPGASHPAEPADRPGGTQPADQPAATPEGPGTKWSKEQPPPAQWSAPTGPQNPAQPPPPPPPGPGWGARPPGGPSGPGYGGPGGPGGYGGHGAPGGWGAGWGGPPPAAKPGVIPLRPLGVGEILDGAVSTMRTHWRTVLGISLTVAIVVQVIVVLLQGLVLDDTTGTTALTDPSATLDEQTRAMRDTLLNSGVVFVIALIGTIAATALLTAVTSRAVLGRSVTTGEAWRDARPQVPRLFGLIFLLLLMAAGVAALGVLPGALLGGDAGAALAVLGSLGSIVVVVWLLVRFSLASPALMLEKQGIRKSLSRSAKLVRGSWWRIFGIQLLSLIIANIVAMIVVVPFALLGAALGEGGLGAFAAGRSDLGWTYLIVSGVGSVIGSLITFPITAGVSVLLYVDQRIRREALDLDLARAAGVQGYGTPSPGTVPGS